MKTDSKHTVGRSPEGEQFFPGGMKEAYLLLVSAYEEDATKSSEEIDVARNSSARRLRVFVEFGYRMLLGREDAVEVCEIG